MVKRKKPNEVEDNRVYEEFGLAYDDSDLDAFISEHEEHVAIDEHALEDELKQQTLSYYEVSKQLGIETSKRDAVKTYLREVEARVDIELRDHARSTSAKMTESEVASKRQIHPDVMEAYRILGRFQTRVRALEALDKAFSQRAFVLRDLCSLWIASYYSKEGDESAGRAVRGGEAESNKKKLNELRKQ